MFRGKESSNNSIISISSRLIEFWCFGLPVALRMGVGGGWGVPPTHVHMHVHARMHMHARTRTCGKHDNFMQMAAPIGGIPWNSL